MMKIFDDKKNCSGCYACYNACSVGAISMEYDEYGCVYPSVDESKCVNCRMCMKACPMINTEKRSSTFEAFAAAEKSDVVLLSASGGIFYSIGRKMIENGGIVFGCAWDMKDDILIPRMICAENESQLERLRGSKYVQAEAGEIYRLVKKALKDEKTVLFSGTPCQVSGLKNYLGKDFSNLYLIDIICHGVPGTEFFRDYIRHCEKKNKSKVKEINFRDKLSGWGLNGSVSVMKNEKESKKIMYEKENSYYSYFLRGVTYRESCYECAYASGERTGDITIGDYWGIEEEHPELLKDNVFDVSRGISCILVNTPKGKELLERFGGDIEKIKSDFSKIAAHNKQLSEPSQKTAEHNEVMERYRAEGYSGVEKAFGKRKNMKWRYQWLKRRLKRILKKQK